MTGEVGMQWQLLFVSMAPILVFTAVEAFGSAPRALRAAIATAVVEALYGAVALGNLEPISALSLLLFLVLGGAALHSGRTVLFKLQPVVLGLVCAAAFWVHDGLIRPGDPLLPRVLGEYVRVNELIPPYQRGYFAGYAATMSTSLPYLLVVHAAWTGWAAVKLSTLWWCAIRVFGFYGMVVALFYAERLFRASY